MGIDFTILKICGIILHQVSKMKLSDGLLNVPHTGECEVNVDILVKKFGKSILSRYKSEFRLANQRAGVKVQIPEKAALEIIQRLGLKEVKSPVFANGSTFYPPIIADQILHENEIFKKASLYFSEITHAAREYSEEDATKFINHVSSMLKSYQSFSLEKCENEILPS